MDFEGWTFFSTSGVKFCKFDMFILCSKKKRGKKSG